MDDDLPFFPLFVDDWLGGTITMTPAMRGAYLSALIAQWKSREVQAIRDDPQTLKRICGIPIPGEVREKFITIHLHGVKHLRNLKLAGVYADRKQAAEVSRSKGKKGAHSRWGKSRPPDGGNGGAGGIAQPLAEALAEALPEPLAGPMAEGMASQSPKTKSQRYSSGVGISSSNPREQKQSAKRPRPPESGESDSGTAATAVDEEFLRKLESNPAYKSLDVRHVYSKLLTWCAQEKTEPSCRRLLQWLNSEKPTGANGVNDGKSRESTAERNARNFRENLQILKSLGSGEDSGSDDPEGPRRLLPAVTKP